MLEYVEVVLMWHYLLFSQRFVELIVFLKDNEVSSKKSNIFDSLFSWVQQESRHRILEPYVSLMERMLLRKARKCFFFVSINDYLRSEEDHLHADPPQPI